MNTTKAQPKHETPAYEAPAGDWQAWARQAIDICQAKLWTPEGRQALDYLRGRGLTDDTIRIYRLGYCPGVWFGELWIQRGVLIPCVIGLEVWYLKIRLLPGEPCRCSSCKTEMPGPGACPKCGEGNKYRGVKGNRTAAIFGADNLLGAEIGIFCEGEFDCMIASQELGDVAGVATMGSAGNHLDLATWGAYLLGLRYILAVYDTDEAGQKGAVALAALTERVAICALPHTNGVKDINDYTLAGGDLWAWLRGNLARLGALPAPAPELCVYT
jgi:DNA primase